MKGSKQQNTRIKIVLYLTLSARAALPAWAEHDANLGGWTEVIGCPVPSWDVCPVYHDEFYFGGLSTSTTETCNIQRINLVITQCP